MKEEEDLVDEWEGKEVHPEIGIASIDQISHLFRFLAALYIFMLS